MNPSLRNLTGVHNTASVTGGISHEKGSDRRMWILQVLNPGTQQAPAPKAPRQSRFPELILAFAATIFVAVAIKSFVGQAPVFTLPARMQDLITLALSIVVEALPFVILGALVSTAIQLLGPTGWLVTSLPQWPPLRRLTISLFGTFMPVCECGNVPVARGLMARGLTVAESTTFLLAAPIINPVTFLATAQAFRMDTSVVWLRMAGALFIANLVGALISLYKNPHTPDLPELPGHSMYNRVPRRRPPRRIKRS